MIEIVKKVKEYFEVRSYYLKTRYELDKLSDRDLADLGIARCNIENIARKAALKRTFS